MRKTTVRGFRKINKRLHMGKINIKIDGISVYVFFYIFILMYIILLCAFVIFIKLC